MRFLDLLLLFDFFLEDFFFRFRSSRSPEESELPDESVPSDEPDDDVDGLRFFLFRLDPSDESLLDERRLAAGFVLRSGSRLDFATGDFIDSTF